MNIEVIITVDYEIFGDGSGDVVKTLIEPTYELMNICEKNNAKLTLMFEIASYWAFKEAEEKHLLQDLNYIPSKVIEEQLKQAIIRGHDVQLHLHPQWIGSKLDDGIWNLNYDYWRLPLLPNGLGNSDDLYSIKGALHKGKSDLEKLLRTIDKGYECMAFRAGSWSIQPEEDVIIALKDLGFKIDTTVFKGGFSNSISYYDFKKAHSHYNFWWSTKKSLTKKGNFGENILEIPIYSQDKLGFEFLSIPRLKSFVSGAKTSLSIENKPTKKQYNISRILNYLSSHQPQKWDFCKLSGKQMVDFLLHVINNEKHSPYVPLVMLGHSKSFKNTKGFNYFLSKCQTSFKNQVNFGTFPEAYKKIVKDSDV